MNRNLVFPISVISTATQQGTLTSEALNSPYNISWASRPNIEGI